jgi:hypothetical protein
MQRAAAIELPINKEFFLDQLAKFKAPQIKSQFLSMSFYRIVALKLFLGK